MALNGLFARMESLINSDGEVDDGMPCKSDILDLRECRKGGDKGQCNALGLDLLECMARFKVDETDRVRSSIGIAKYNEYLQHLEAKHGSEEAAKIIAEPAEQLKDVEAMKMLHNLSKNTHPKASSRTKDELDTWSHVDRVRFAMGEQEWWSSVGVIASEFGVEKADRLFGLRQETQTLQAATERIYPGTKDAQAKRFDQLKKIMDPVSDAANGAKTVDEVMAAFKKVYPTQADLEAQFS